MDPESIALLFLTYVFARSSELSARIEKLASLTRPGHVLYDMCCDHGLIGFAALSRASRVVFVDQSSPALQSVIDRIATLEGGDKQRTEVFVRPGELVDIRHERAADFVIAGVGVTTIASIVAALFPDGLGDHRLILAPHNDPTPLRWFLRDKGFRLHSETVVKERKHYREMIVVEAQGEEIGESYANSDNALSREYIAWLKACRDFIAERKRNARLR